MFLIVVLTVLWIIHGYVAWKVIPTLGLTSSGSIVAYILIFFLSILPLLPILLRYSGSETKIIDRISLFGYTSLGFFVLSFLILLTKDLFGHAVTFVSYLMGSQQEGQEVQVKAPVDAAILPASQFVHTPAPSVL